MTKAEQEWSLIEALEYCKKKRPSNKSCAGCPYAGLGCGIDAAIEKLKAQEPRLVTEADFENADAYGYLPVWVEDKDDSEVVCDCITKTAITDTDSGNHYRYWTSRPSDEQRQAVKWDE